MGLLKAGVGALSGVLADQWREYFYCEALSADVLAVKGEKRTGGRSSNKRASDNIISNGSIIAVADGQCMMIVEQGKVVDLCAEPGEFVYDTSTEPSIMYGGLKKENILASLKTIGRRFTFGGDTGKDQRVYYFNTKEILGNKYGTVNPIPYRVVDTNIGLDMDIALRCNGEYSYKIVDPLAFYAKVCGNVEEDYKRDNLASQLRTELLTALQPAIGKLSELGIRYSAIPAHTTEITKELNEQLSVTWTELRGIEVVSFGINSLNASEEDEKLIKMAQRNAIMRDPTMYAAQMGGAAAQAMQDAANNPNGAMMGFAGVGMAMNAAGGMGNAASLFAMGQQQAQQPAAPAPQAAPVPPAANAWTCSCGEKNTGKFCTSCGKPKPADGWTCECGTVNQGKFCQNCGKKKPADAPLYKCDKCGWTPDDPYHPPKFCPECGDVFDERDAT
ncbi:MAG: SPFH domain-containing protein [Clostridia bacterium]|nr:SPFH domain-containing protein [Clostridia bacterium]